MNTTQTQKQTTTTLSFNTFVVRCPHYLPQINNLQTTSSNNKLSI